MVKYSLLLFFLLSIKLGLFAQVDTTFKKQLLEEKINIDDILYTYGHLDDFIYGSHLANSFVSNINQSFQIINTYYTPYVIKKRIAYGINYGLGLLNKNNIVALFGMSLKLRLKDWYLSDKKTFFRLFQENNLNPQGSNINNTYVQINHLIGLEYTIPHYGSMYIKTGIDNFGEKDIKNMYNHNAFSISLGLNFYAPDLFDWFIRIPNSVF